MCGAAGGITTGATGAACGSRGDRWAWTGVGVVVVVVDCVAVAAGIGVDVAADCNCGEAASAASKSMLGWGRKGLFVGGESDR